MILFVFEGAKREPALFQTIFHLFFPHAKDKILCSYNNNIYNLYKEMHPDEEGFTQDIVSVLRQQWQGKPDNPFKDINQTSDFSEVFLFFDYDCHHQNKNQTLTVQQLNNRLKEMLAFFNNETENGKHIVSQLDIFSAQVNTYINSLTSVSILNSIPLFIYEYFDL